MKIIYLKVPLFILLIFCFVSCTNQSQTAQIDTQEGNSSQNSNSQHPQFIQEMLTNMSQLDSHEQPLAITRYKYAGNTVYYVSPPCCDQFSKLYDADGNLLGAPDGGITGKGDGRVSDFMHEKSDAYGIWKKGK